MTVQASIKQGGAVALQAAQQARNRITMRAVVKVIYVFVNSPAVWQVTAGAVVIANPLLEFMVHLSSVAAVDLLFLLALANLEQRKNDPWAARWVDIGMSALFLAFVIGIGLLNGEGVAGFFTRAIPGVFLIVMAVRESLTDQILAARQDRMDRTKTATPEQAKFKEEQDMLRFKALQEAETRVATAEAKYGATAAIADSEAKSAVAVNHAKQFTKLDAEARKASNSDLMAKMQLVLTERFIEGLRNGHGYLESHAVLACNGNGYGVWCPRQHRVLFGDRSALYGSPGAAQQALEEHVASCQAPVELGPEHASPAKKGQLAG
jgi:hypothetical protein